MVFRVKNIFYMFLFVLFCGSAAMAQNANYFVHISVYDNGNYENPALYSLTASDFEWELVLLRNNCSKGADDNAGTLTSEYYFAVQGDFDVFRGCGVWVPFQDEVECRVRINKPGHPMDGQSHSIRFLMTDEGLQSYILGNGIVFTPSGGI